MLTKTIEIKKILSSMKNIRLIEIGVYHANNARECLKNFDIFLFVLIDPYIALDYYAKRYGSKKLVKKNKKIAHHNLKQFENKKKTKLIWIEETSEEAAKKLENNFFDIVYIDGNHQYDYVFKDIENYIPKLKKGGIIIGDDFFKQEWHDYIDKNNLLGRGLPDVTKAVKNYCNTHDIAFNIDYPSNKELGGTLRWWWKIS